MNFYQRLLNAKENGVRQLAILIDPDNCDKTHIEKLVELAIFNNVDYFFVGGSLVLDDRMDTCLKFIRSRCDIPLILFPGNTYQLSEYADAILFLSLISGRNPELLIGNQVVAAPYLRQSKLEVVSCGYMLVDGGVSTSVSYMSQTLPIPADKPDIALSTAMAGEYLGLKSFYLDAGSGAERPVPLSMIRAVSKDIAQPLIVGGGIRSAGQANDALNAGANVIVVGNAIEKDPELMTDIAQAVQIHKAISR